MRFFHYTLFIIHSTLAVCALALSASAQTAPEWGRRPADGETVSVNPPAFTWPHDKHAASYEVQWSATPGFEAPVTVTGIPWCVYVHNAPLAPGEWHWRYRPATAKAKGETSAWSPAYRVVIPDDATVFPMPTRAEQAARLPATHPRLFMRPEDLPRLRAAAITPPTDALFQKIRREADRIIERGPTPEPAHRGSARDKNDAEAVKHWWPNRVASDRAGQEAETLAFVWLITREPKYGEAARRFITALTAWDPDGNTNFALNCEAGKVLLYRPARAYDWACDALTDADRAAFRAVWTRRAADAWKSGEAGHGNGHLSQPYNSHGNRLWHKLGELGIALHGEVPEAATWLDYAVNKFHAVYPVWSDDDGGWHEGLSYMSSYVERVSYWMQVAHSALGIDGMKKPFFAHIGEFPIYIAPPGASDSGFGDLSHGRASCNYLHYFARMKGDSAAHWAWWLRETDSKGPSGWIDFLYAANLPPLPSPRAPDNLPASRIFRGTGIAALHTSLADSRSDIRMLFKASPFGTISHGHNAQLGFSLSAYGEMLLPAMTYRDLHGSAFHTKWCWSTRSQNAVLVDGAGQMPHSATATACIADSRLTPSWDYVRGEAAAAYAGRVTRAERSILFHKDGFILLRDDFATPAPATWQFMFHALAPFEIDAPTQTLRLRRNNAALVVRFLAREPLALSQTDGFDPPPQKRTETQSFSNQWHIEASTAAPAGESDMLTLLLPHRPGVAPDWRAERVDTTTASGVRVALGGRTYRVAFRKAGVATAHWDGETFDTPVAVFEK